MVKIEQIMSREVIHVQMDDMLYQVREIFATSGFHHLPVVEKNQLMGIVSDRDLLRALSPALGTLSEQTRDLCTLNIRVHQIMTRNPICLFTETSLTECITLFNRYHFSCFPVTNKDYILTGILSWRDVFSFFEKSISLQPDHHGSL